MPVARRQRRGAGWRGQPRGTVEDLEQARARGGGALGEVEDHAERAHRSDQHVQVQVERGELAERQVRVDHGVAPDQKHRGEAELGQEADHRVELRFQPRGDHRLAEYAPDAALKVLQLAGLAREGLDDAHAGDVLLGVGGQLGDALLGLLDRRTRAAAVAVGDQHHEWHRRERDQAEARFGDDHHGPREHDREDRLQDEHEPVAEEEAHGLQIDGRARHQLARLLAVEEAELELLQVAVEQLAQVVFDAEREPPGDHPPPVHEPPARQHDQRDRAGDQRQFVARARLRGAVVMLRGPC